ncbi:MAG: ribosome maturation factor RimM [Treponema sp.]|nr:ribosome maturation factor RimM [Treponema sp.]
MTERFVVGVLGAPFGLKGHVKVHSFSGEYEHLKQLERVTLRQRGDERVLELEETIPITGALGMQFKGIHTPEAAKALTGAELLADRAHAAPLKPDEFYVEDLRGLRVVLEKADPGSREDGAALGYISDVLEGGGASLIEIRLSSGELKLVPFRKEFFGDINLETHTAVLVEGWILA